MVSRSKNDFAYFHSFLTGFIAKFYIDKHVPDLHVVSNKYLKIALNGQDS